jgi:murein DD-endopeptidase MepM/ murein hydrolase activator NlpD
MKRKLVFVSFVIFCSILFILYTISTAATDSPTEPAWGEEEAAIETAVIEAIQGEREFVLAYLVFDVQVAEVEVVEDGTRGIAYLELIDPQSGDVIPSEPGIAIAIWDETEWRIILPSDPEWFEWINILPEEMITEEYRVSKAEMNAALSATAGAAYGGYLLPWEAGKTVYLSRSVGHDYSFSGGHYAFDFANGQMFPLHAAKSGTVWRARWEVDNFNDDDMGNYLVLQDTTTNPTTYQLYLHLAKDSIPAELRTQGAYVTQGQFIGLADDTGKSTGHHLHYQVHTNPYSYWGTSIDITFDDVDINGGRPRNLYDKNFCIPGVDVCDVFRSSYVSGNFISGDSTPPSADLFEPSTGLTVSSPTLHAEGWASDADSGLYRGSLIAYFNNQWQEVGETFSDLTFSLDWDMCEDNVPDGPLSIAVRAWDRAGNPTDGLPGLTHLIKDYSCLPVTPQCTPGEDQIAVYSDTDFRGQCQTLDIGSYPDVSGFSLIGDNDIESIQVGQNVFAHLFGVSDFNGRSATMAIDDSNLADNPVGNNTISSIRVSPQDDPPYTPLDLIYPINGEFIPADASLSFSWRDPGGVTQYKVFVSGPTSFRSPWISSTFWHPAGIVITEGEYSWKVRARNCPEPECYTDLSLPTYFTVTSATPNLQSDSVPFSDDMENGDNNWHSSPMWNLLNDVQKSFNGSGTSWYYGLSPENNFDTGHPNYGDLTLRPISIPGTGYVLRFWYLYDTEDPASNWDQRWVQISTNGGPYENVLQLKDDVSNYWVQATLDLTQYAGQNINIRFHFVSLDDQLNGGEGWYIDDVVIEQYSYPPCSDSDNNPTGASEINFDQTLNRRICPSGDLDYFKFQGAAGDRIVLDIDTPKNPPNDNLDLYLFLLDGDGSSQLTAHDDEILGIRKDPHLGYQLSRSGIYYVRARLWSHPYHGGEDFTYDITLSMDNDKPQGALTYPLSGAFLQGSNPFLLNVDASDNGSGISHVDFLFHSGNWLNSSWQLLGSDLDSSDGWTYSFDSASLPEQAGIAFAVKIYDWAGNMITKGSWDIVIDRTPPITELDNLPAEQTSTAVKLQWSGSDNLSGLDQYEMQVQIDNGPWTDINPHPDVNDEEYWYIGQAGKEYSFRMRGVDKAGNWEAYPSSAETSSTVPQIHVLCSELDPWDDGTNDNSPDQATFINIDDNPKVHNFCNPLRADRLDDEDWIKIVVEEREKYLFSSFPLTGMSAAVLELYASDGTTLLASTSSGRLGQSSQLIWTAEQNEQLFLRVRHSNGNIVGNDVLYLLAVNKFKDFYLPLLFR